MQCCKLIEHNSRRNYNGSPVQFNDMYFGLFSKLLSINICQNVKITSTHKLL